MFAAARKRVVGALLCGTAVAVLPCRAHGQGPIIAVPPPSYYYTPGGPRAYRATWRNYVPNPYAAPLFPLVPASPYRYHLYGMPGSVPWGTGMWMSPRGYRYRPEYRSEVMPQVDPSPEAALPDVETIPAPEPE